VQRDAEVVIDDARRAAFELLASVRRDDVYANLQWPAVLERYRLAGRDAAFATDLAYGTLRWLGFYDLVAAEVSSRPWTDVDPDIVDIVRLGVHQLLSMRVPDHAAVDSSCQLARAVGITDEGRVGFINGLLRAVARRDRSQWDEVVGRGKHADELAAAVTSHPRWVTEALHQALALHTQGAVSDEALCAALRANNEPSRPTVAFLDDPPVLEAGLTPGRWSRRAATVDAGLPSNVEAVRQGRAIIQDEGSQLVLEALLAVPVSPPESAWLDMCAGPGGKAAVLASRARTQSVDFVAVELHAHRAALVESLLSAGASGSSDVVPHILTADACERPWGSQFFDRILLDAPCTGLGALRRRPESRWRRNREDVSELASLQRRLLATGLSSLRSGGVLAYVTCSPHIAETIDVVEEVLLHIDDVQVLDAREFLPNVPDLGPGPHVQLWPHLHGTDAMHLTLMRRD
jgi:16S rRNA (cytosine967-C5)-methyltransferase